MAKANDKKVVKRARELLLDTLGNLLESHRERKFRTPHSGEPLSRAEFCQGRNLNESTVAHIETGRVLGLGFPQLRQYLATTHGRSDSKFSNSAKKVYDGLKELDSLLKML
jgi:hypothetical protein